MATFSGNFISDQNIIQLSTDRLIRDFAWDEFPTLKYLKVIPATGDIKHYWLNAQTSIVQTQLNGAMTGGAASETITVDSTAYFAVNNVVLLGRDGTNDMQLAYISAIPSSTTTMTINALSGNLSAFADNTYVSLAGNRTEYGETVTQPLRLATRDYNIIEQFQVAADIPVNVAKAQSLNLDSIEAMLTNEAMSVFKQQLTMKVLFGQQVDPTGSDSHGQMDGLYNLVGNSTSGTWSKANFRDFVNTIKKYRGFPGQRGTIIANANLVNQLYKLDDSNTGISWRDTDKPIDEVVIRGVRFKVIEEPAMNDHFASNEAAAFLLSPKTGNKQLIKLATISADEANGKPRKVLKEAVKYTLQVASFATLELMDPYRHGVYIGTFT